MTTLTVCYIEDDTSEGLRYRSTINKALKGLGWTNDIQIELVNFNQGYDKIFNEQVNYDLFVIDILESKEKQQDKTTGLALIGEAFKKPECAVVAISRVESYRKQSITAGADGFVYKDDIGTEANAVEFLAGILKEALIKKKIDLKFVPYDKITQTPFNDYLLDADIRAIGRPNIFKLVEKVEGTMPIKIDISRIRPGLSGASVFKCTFSARREQHQEDRTLLLKISKNFSVLEKEFHGIDEISGIFPAGLFAQYLKICSPMNTETEGWYALGSEFQGYAITFSDWILAEKDTSKIESVLNFLFLERGLASGYKAAQKEENHAPSISIWSILDRYGRASRVRHASVQLAELCQHFLTRDLDLTLLNNFIDSKRFSAVDEERPGKSVTLVKSHGDLHSRNILVDKDKGVPIIIDTANIEYLHWSNDISRFAVDLLLSSVDSGLQSYEWQNVDRWLTLFHSLIHLEPIVKTKATKADLGSVHAMAWIISKHQEIFKIAGIPFKKWEFQLGLAVEFLRGTYRVQDLSIQKRCFALLVGLEGLSIASKTFQSEQ